MDTISRGLVALALQHLRHPRFRETEAEIYRKVIDQVRPGAPAANVLLAFNLFQRGRLAEGIETVLGPGFPPPARKAVLYMAHLEGVPIPPETLDRVMGAELGAEVDDRTRSVDLFFAGAWAGERGRESERAAARGQLRDLAGRLRGRTPIPRSCRSRRRSARVWRG